MIDTEKNKYLLEQEEKSQENHIPQEKFNFGILYLGLLFVVLGIVYFYTASNASAVKIMVSYAQLWPLLVVSFGLSIFSARSTKTIAIGVFVSSLAVALTVGSVLTPDQVLDNNQTQYAAGIQEGVTEADIIIENTAGRVNVQGGLQGNLIETFYDSNYKTLEPKASREGEKQTITLRQSDYWEGIGNYYKNLTTRLNTETPTQIKVTGNAMDVTMDLSDVPVSQFNLTTTGSDVMITLGDKVEEATFDLDVTASSATIIVPRELGVEVIPALTLTTRNFESLVANADGSIYRSNNYEDKERKAQIIVNGLVSRISIVQQQ